MEVSDKLADFNVQKNLPSVEVVSILSPTLASLEFDIVTYHPNSCKLLMFS